LQQMPASTRRAKMPKRLTIKSQARNAEEW
jgi:hypothetical protein